MSTDILEENVSKVIIDIFLQVAKIAVIAIEKPTEVFCDDIISLVTTTKGDYSFEMAMYAHEYMINAICQNMKHSTQINKEDIQDYVGEFFNIICGQIVSNFNRQTKKSALFSIPKVIYGYFNLIANGNIFWYKSNLGIIKFVINLSAS